MSPPAARVQFVQRAQEHVVDDAARVEPLEPVALRIRPRAPAAPPHQPAVGGAAFGPTDQVRIESINESVFLLHRH